MNTGRQNSITDLSGAQAALMKLCRPYLPRDFVPDCEVVRSDAIPTPARELLVHQGHMTIELERHHGRRVEVQVMEEHLHGDLYNRKIALTLAGTSVVVEWGICLVNFRHLSPQIREEILAKQSPLGAILTRHDVYRRIEPRYFVRFPGHSPVIQLFVPGGSSEPVYGRLGSIYCDDESAIELLEIVVNTEVKSNP